MAVQLASGMSLALTEEQAMLQQIARKFAQEKIAPIAAGFDESGEFPVETVREMGRLGLMGIEVPEAYGGAGMDAIAYVLAMVEISKADASHGTVMSVNNSLYCHAIIQYGTEEQKKKYVTPVASGQVIGAYSLTEPMSGSAASMLAARRMLPIMLVQACWLIPRMIAESSSNSHCSRLAGKSIRYLTSPLL